ncbi:MAG: response regulator [Deltaproteobacteria bacterium]|nr:response regulator [Deltaproteobacteria bacterium]MBN2672938.1 response regulator [Deltaproteobacteria bacterium]
MKRNWLKILVISLIVGILLMGVHIAVLPVGRSMNSEHWIFHLLEFIFGFLLCLGIFWTLRKFRDTARSEAAEQVALRDSLLAEAKGEIEQHVQQRKRAEQELVQAQKLEALGRLAGGIAHDVNNVLASIMSIASSMKLDMEVGSGQPQKDDIYDILDACRRGRDLTLSLLGFARKGDFFKRPISLVKEIKEAKKLLERVSPRTLNVKAVYHTNVPQIEGDPSEIKNVLMNLCINGIDAMNGNGVLTVSLETVELQGEGDMAEGSYVLLKVTDTGEGMSEETMRRAFEPFYTTKPEGKGTGLGLPRVWGIVKEHAGKVEIDSDSGVGTTINVWFPALDEAREDPGIKGSNPPVYGGAHTVLLIDDEDLIRKSGTRILQKIGYNVIAAENGKVAVDKLTENPEAVDLVLLDMIMPVMDGPAAFAAIRALRPDVPIILCSGYSKDDSATELLKQGNVGFVQKPFSIGEISTRMAKILKSQ